MPLEWLKNLSVDALLELVGPHIQDNDQWLRLALACIDQAGVSLSGQVRISRAIERERPAPTPAEQEPGR